MPANTTSETWDTHWSLTRRTVRPKVVDNIFEKYPTVAEFRKSALSVKDSGGKEIEVKLEYATGSATAFDGYDELPKSPIDPVTSGFARRRYYAVPIILSQTKEWENAGEERIMSELRFLQDNAMKSLLKAINEDIYSAQTGKNMLGFQDLIADASGTDVMGIDVAANTWFENQRDTTAATFLTQTTTNIFNGFTRWNSLMDDIRIQGGKVSHIFTTWSIVNAYRTALSSQGYARTTVEDAGGVGGDFAPMFYTAKVIPDNDCPALHSYMIDKDYIKLNCLRSVNFKKTPFTSLQPNGQLAQLAYQVVSVQMTTDNRRCLGVNTALTGN